MLPQTDLIKKAINFIEKAHQGKTWINGEPYINHCLEVAGTIFSWRLDEASIVAGLLHNITQDSRFKLEDIKKEFGEEISILIGSIDKLGKIKYREIPAQIENLRNLLLALSKDLRVVLIKLADRWHIMKTLATLPSEEQKKIALETTEIYAPLAYRLGMHQLSGELEDLAFPHLYPKEYQWLQSTFQELYRERQKYLEKVRLILTQELKTNNISLLKIESRIKRYSSLYKKLQKYNLDIEKIHDLVALRVIVSSIEECYAVLGIIHKLWPPVPGRIKDYIALPKPNGYRSLHTDVFCFDDKIIEIQIRTKQMHEEAEYGVAAYWTYQAAKKTKLYKKGMATFASPKDQILSQQLRAWQKELPDSKEFLKALKIDFFKDRIFAITPKGEVVDLPLGATPVDFAYAIHSQIGNQCVGAKVNDKIVPLSYKLQSGDLVKILTQKNKKPSESWLKFVKTTTARVYIKKALRASKTSFLKRRDL